MQQELQLRRLAVQEIELENRERRALNATKRQAATATNEVTGAVQANTGAMGSASFALLSFGQGLQDSAQFGMGAAQGLRAVNNNIQQFVTALALGSEQAGGMKNLLRDMRGLLIGPAGVIVAFSLVSAALEFFTTRAQRAKKDAEDLSNAMLGLTTVAGPSQFEAGSSAGLSLVAASLLRVKTSAEVALNALDTAIERVRQQKYDEFINDGIANPLGRAAEATLPLVKQQKELRTELERQIEEFGDLAKEKAKEAEAARELEIAQARLIKTMGVDGVVRAIREQTEAFEESERIVKRASMVAAAGFGTEAEFNKGFEAFSQSLSSINPKIKITEEEFAKLSEKGGLDKFLADEQWRVTVKNLDAVKKESEEIAKAWEKILGADGRMTIADLSDPAEVPDRLTAPRGIRDAIAEYEEYRNKSNELVDQNQRLRESFAQLGADLLVSFATMGGGFNAFMRTMGQFLSKYGAEMVKHGLLTSALGVSVEAVKEALSKFNGKAAIVAGLALVAIGSRLRANARNASRRLQGGSGAGGGGRFTAPSFGAMSMVPTIGQGSVFQSQMFSPAPQSAQRVELVASGRSLVSAVGSEMSASSRRVGGTPINFSGATAASGVFVDINRDDLVK
jgi:hypothetical protein